MYRCNPTNILYIFKSNFQSNFEDVQYLEQNKLIAMKNSVIGTTLIFFLSFGLKAQVRTYEVNKFDVYINKEITTSEFICDGLIITIDLNDMIIDLGDQFVLQINDHVYDEKNEFHYFIVSDKAVDFRVCGVSMGIQNGSEFFKIHSCDEDGKLLEDNFKILSYSYDVPLHDFWRYGRNN